MPPSSPMDWSGPICAASTATASRGCRAISRSSSAARSTSRREPRLSQDRAATFVLDGGHGFGPVAMMQAAAIAAERAPKAGVCFGLVRDTTHTGAIGRYAQWMAQRGCAALIMGAGPAFVAYHGARVASLGTSPIAIAVPSGDEPDRARHGDQHHLQRHDLAGARHRRGAAARHRAHGAGRADHRSRNARKFCCRSAAPRARGSA